MRLPLTLILASTLLAISQAAEDTAYLTPPRAILRNVKSAMSVVSGVSPRNSAVCTSIVSML